MFDVGVRRRARTPTHSIEDGYFWAGILVIFAFGMTLAAINESYTSADWGWFVIFVQFEAGLTGIYFWIVWCWLAVVSRSGD